jgi:hypothetical protein
MWLFRVDRFRTARSILAATLVYVIAATGLLGSVARAAGGLESSGFVVICTTEGQAIAHDGAQPTTKAAAAHHCGLCNVTPWDPSRTVSAVGAPVEMPAAPRAPVRSYDPVLPAHAFEGWLGTRSPRAPPFAS